MSHRALGNYVKALPERPLICFPTWGIIEVNFKTDCHFTRVKEPTGKLHESNPAPPHRLDTNHKDPAQQADVAHYLTLANMWLVWSPSFIWHFPFHNALSSTELRILLSYRNLLKNLSRGVGERTQNKLSNGICVILHKVQVILGRTE